VHFFNMLENGLRKHVKQFNQKILIDFYKNCKVKGVIEWKITNILIAFERIWELLIPLVRMF